VIGKLLAQCPVSCDPSHCLLCHVPCRRFYLLFQQHCRYDNAVTISRTMGEYSYHMVRPAG
jgi:hypothetical protein